VPRYQTKILRHIHIHREIGRSEDDGSDTGGLCSSEVLPEGIGAEAEGDNVRRRHQQRIGAELSPVRRDDNAAGQRQAHQLSDAGETQVRQISRYDQHALSLTRRQGCCRLCQCAIEPAGTGFGQELSPLRQGNLADLRVGADHHDPLQAIAPAQDRERVPEHLKNQSPPVDRSHHRGEARLRLVKRLDRHHSPEF